MNGDDLHRMVQNRNLTGLKNLLKDKLVAHFVIFQIRDYIIFTGSDVTESIYCNVAMGWQVPIHRSPIVSLHIII